MKKALASMLAFAKETQGTAAKHPMPNLQITEIKAFVPSKDFALSKQFYQDLGFKMAFEGGGIAHFHFGGASFLLQDFCAESFAENFMMHLLVEDVDSWWDQIQASGVLTKYGVRVTALENQPWRMRDFCIHDPSGVLWRIGQNMD
jgi:uncharacterized glyoxalase superfamily protein PhnB